MHILFMRYRLACAYRIIVVLCQTNGGYSGVTVAAEKRAVGRLTSLKLIVIICLAVYNRFMFVKYFLNLYLAVKQHYA